MPQGLRLNQAPNPPAPPANKGDLFYSSDLSPAGLAWIDEDGLVTRLTGPGRGDVYNVRDYGALGDGATDDSTAFAAALAAVPTDSILVVPPGNYNLASWSVVALTKQITLLGFDREATTITGPGSTDFLTTSKVFKVEGLKFTNWGSLFTLDPVVTTIQSVMALHCWFDDCGIVINWQNEDPSGLVGSVVVHRNRFTSMNSFGVLGQGAVNTLQITHNTVDGLTGRAFQWGENTYSKQDGWKNLIVTNNTIRNITVLGSNEPGAILLYGYQATVADNIIDTITASSTLECWGIYTKVKYASISGNTIRGLTTGGSGLISPINIKGSLRGTSSSPNGYSVVCAANTIYCNGSGSGIRSEGDDHLVANNIIDDPGVDGISVDASSGNRNAIRGNKVYGTNRASTVGIRLSTGVSVEVATENDIYNFPIGVRVSSATLTTTDVEVSRNNFSSCGQCIVVTFSTGSALVTRFTAQGNRGDTSTDGISFEGTGATATAHVVRNIFTNTTNPVKFGSAAFPLNLTMLGNEGWTVQTTDATTTTVTSVTLPDEGVYVVEAKFLAAQSDFSNRAYYERKGRVYRDAAGAATMLGTGPDIDDESDATWGGGVLDVSSNNYRVRVTGKAATTINWRVQIDVRGLN